MGEVTAAAALVEEVKREGKSSWYKVHLTAPVTHEQYTGQQLATFSSTCAKAVQEKGIGVACVYTVRPAKDHPDWSPSITRAVNVATGEVLYDRDNDPSEQRGGGGRGGRGRGGGDWETADERFLKNRSIEAQSASDRAVALAIAGMGERPSGGELGLKDVQTALRFVEEATPRIAKAIRKATLEGVQEAALRPKPAPQPPATPAPTPAAGGAGPGPAGAAAPSGATGDGSDLQALRNQALAQFGGKPSGVAERYRDLYGQEKMLGEMTEDELVEVLNAGAV